MKSKERAGSGDGLRLDAKGNIWTTGPGGVLILSPEGRHLGSILCGQATANLTWGDDGHTLYITSKDIGGFFVPKEKNEPVTFAP